MTDKEQKFIKDMWNRLRDYGDNFVNEENFCTLKKITESNSDEDCISRKAVEDITWQDPSYSDALNALTEVREKVRALPSIQPKSKWISVKDRLPDESGLYWVTYKYWTENGSEHLGTDVMYSSGKGEEFSTRDGWSRVLAWMPLPSEPYKSESEK